MALTPPVDTNIDPNFQMLCEVAHAHSRILDRVERELCSLSGNKCDLRTNIADILRDISLDRAALADNIPTLDDLRAHMYIERITSLVNELYLSAELAQRTFEWIRAAFNDEPQNGLVDHQRIRDVRNHLARVAYLVLTTQELLGELLVLCGGELIPPTIPT